MAHKYRNQIRKCWLFLLVTRVQSCGWGLVNPHLCPQLWRSKKNSNSTQFIELYFGVSEQIKPLQPIGQAAEFKFESKFKPLPTSAGHLAITPEGYSRRQSKDLTAISMAKLLGQRSSSACAGRTGEHKQRVFPVEQVAASRCWLRPACLPVRKMCYHSCYTDSVWQLKRF